MNLLRTMVSCCLFVLAWSAPTFTNASIIYNVDRIIGDGTVTGFIQTDGTFGVLGSVNITDWTFTLTAPNLDGGSPGVIDLASSGATTGIMGSALTATSTQLSFDFGLAENSYALFLGGTASQNFWCLSTAIGDCTGDGIGEHMGWPTGQVGSNPGAAQSQVYTGAVVFAEVTSVPLPAALWLFGSGVLFLASIAKRNKSA